MLSKNFDDSVTIVARIRVAQITFTKLPKAIFGTRRVALESKKIAYESPVTYRLSGTLDRLRKLDMVRHCKWIAYGTDGLGGKGCTRMRRSCTCPFLVTLSESLVS